MPGRFEGEVRLQREGRPPHEHAARVDLPEFLRPVRSVMCPSSFLRRVWIVAQRHGLARSRRCGRGRAPQRGRQPPSATSAFCSTTSEATPSAFRRRTVASTSATTFGARPWLGSSKSTSPGRAEQRPRDGNELHLAAREVLRLAVHQVLERREDAEHILRATRRKSACAWRRSAGSSQRSGSGTGAGRRAPSRCRAARCDASASA